MKHHVSLLVKCPHCGKSLMDEEHKIHDKATIKLNIECEASRGVIYLCSLYGCYDKECAVGIKDQEIGKFYCPHCNQSLTRDINCKLCDAPMVGMNIKVGGKVNICSRCGCENHYVVFEDLTEAINKFYHEYGFSG
nr:hypothetical protein [Bacteroidota bacterium]